MRTFVAGALLLSISMSVMAAEEIKCPVDMLRAQVSTPLPEGWWYSPTEGGVKSVRAQTIAGQPMLICIYQAFHGQVSVSRHAPKGKQCQADNKSKLFRCR